MGFKTEETDNHVPDPNLNSTDNTKKRKRILRRSKSSTSTRNKQRRRRFFSCSSSKVDASVESSDKSSSGAINEQEEIELQRRYPNSTVNERRRFLTSRSLARATEKMNYYMAWRRQYQLDSPSFRDHPAFRNDIESWNFAVSHASRHYKSGGQLLPQTLPRIVKFGDESDVIAMDGKRVAHVLPGLIDKEMAPLEFYALCVAIYLDLKFDRHSDESIYVMIDVRSGLNWPNPSPSSLVPFVKNLIKNLSDNMPERMYRTIVYPIPAYAKAVWLIYKKFLDPRQVQKIEILWGPASVNSPIPNEMRFKKNLGKSLIDVLERSRQKEFYN